MKKYVKTAITLSLLIVFAFTLSASVAEANSQELQRLREIENTLNTIKSFLGQSLQGIPDGFTFQKNLSLGTRDTDVKYLQIALNSSSDTKVAQTGYGSPGNETNYFGPKTHSAVIKFQEKYASEILAPHNLLSGTGFVGPSTRTKLNSFLQLTGTDVSQEILDLLKKVEEGVRRIYERLGEDPDVDPTDETVEGSISCYSSTGNTITISYEVEGGSNTSLFRSLTRVYSIGSGDKSGTYTVKGLSSDTEYTFYLRNGAYSSSEELDIVRCKTEEESDEEEDYSAQIGCARQPGVNYLYVSVTFSSSKDLYLFRNNKLVANAGAGQEVVKLYKDINLPLGVDYIYTLREGDSLSSPEIARNGEGVCSTEERWPGDPGGIEMGISFPDGGYIVIDNGTDDETDDRKDDRKDDRTDDRTDREEQTTGSISCTVLSDTEIRINYSFTNGENVSLFRRDSRVAILGSGNRTNLVYTDRNLTPDTSYTYYLRSGTVVSSSPLSSATCKTRKTTTDEDDKEDIIVTFDGNGGSCSPARHVMRAQFLGGTVLGPDCTREGYELRGFSVTSGKCYGTFHFTSGTCTDVRANMTVRANWKLVDEDDEEEDVIVTFDGNGGSCSPARQVMRAQFLGGTVFGPDCTRAGYELTGFTVTKGKCYGTFHSNTGTCTDVRANMTVRANWKLVDENDEEEDIIVTFDGNGGSCSPARQVMRAKFSGGTVHGPDCTRAGHELTEFTVTSGKCYGTFYSNTGTCTDVRANMTVRANWE